MKQRSNTTRANAIDHLFATDCAYAMGRAYAIVTGATSGIGAEFAHQFASRGFNLIITGRRANMLLNVAERLKNRYGIAIRTVVGDLRNRETIETLLSTIAGVDVEILVNNAGYSSGGDLADRSPTDLLDLLRVLAEVPLRTMAVVLPQMKKRRHGVVINVGSLAGRLAVPRASIYVASKAFLERLSETVALETAASRVVVQALLPGYVKTDFHRDVADYREKQRSKGVIRWTDAARVVEHSLKAVARAQKRVEAGKRPLPRDIVVIPGAVNRALVFLSRLTPRRVFHHAALHRKPM